MESNIQLKEDASKMGLKIEVCTKDDMPKKPISCIINLQDDFSSDGTDLGGTHWCAVYRDGKQACYFDPIGMPPPAQVQVYLYPCRPYPYNSQQVQDERGGYCGKYCIYFLYFMTNNKQIKSIGDRLDRFLKLFSTDPRDNERLLLNHYLK
jgi:hypothetical protein